MAVRLSPLFNGWQGFGLTGLPTAGGLINTYQAGTATPQATYTTNTGATPNANPIVLDASGRPPAEIWLTEGVSYKFILTDSLGNALGTYDNIAGIGDISALASTTPPTGASLVGFKQALSGAVGRTLQAKCSDRVCVFDFMTTAQIADVQSNAATLDMYAPCTNAMLSLGANGGTVYFPRGTYKLVTSLTVPSGVFLEGESMRGTQLNSPAADYALKFPAAVRSGASKMFLNGAGTGYGVFISLVSTQIQLDRVWHDSCVVGLMINNSYFIDLWACSFQNCLTSIAGQVGANNVSIVACQLNNGTIAMAATGVGIDFQGEMCAWHIHATAFEGFQPVKIGSLAYGIHFDGNLHENVTATVLDSAFIIGSFSGTPIIPHGITIENSYINNNITNGVWLKACEATTIVNNYFQNLAFAFKIRRTDSPRRGICLEPNSYNINNAGYDATKIVTYDGVWGDALTCNFADINNGGLNFRGTDGIVTAALENGEMVLSHTNSAPAKPGLVADRTYITKKAAGVATDYLVGYELQATAVYDPPNVAPGAFDVGTTVAVTGAALGDYVEASFSLDTTGLWLLPRMSAAGVVTVNLWNPTAGAINLGSGTLAVRVKKL